MLNVVCGGLLLWGQFLLIYCDVYVCLVRNSGPFEIVYVRECQNVGEDSIRCIICCIDSGIF